jgi:hypothetical protein
MWAYVGGGDSMRSRYEWLGGGTSSSDVVSEGKEVQLRSLQH